MNILIVSQYFSPENFRINDLADELNHRGNNITVLTGIPNYPNGKYFNGYGVFKKNKEKINNIKIIRSPIIPRGSGSGIRLALNYLSFVFGAILAISSSLHSFLILYFTSTKRASLDVGFYYMSNAAGRLIGTFLSGLSYQMGGLAYCLLFSTILLSFSFFWTLLLQRESS